jgi:capping protein beta
MLRAALTASGEGEPTGSWDSIHVFEASERGRTAHYKLTSTVMLSLITRTSSSSASSLYNPITLT